MMTKHQAKEATVSQLIRSVITDHCDRRALNELRRRADEEDLFDVLSAAALFTRKSGVETKEEFLDRMDNLPLDPTPIGAMCRRMLASGWKMTGFRETPEYIRNFLSNEDMWMLSEYEMTIPQRRMFRVAKAKFIQHLRGDCR